MEAKITKDKWYIERTSEEEDDFQCRILCESSENNDPHNPEKPQVHIIIGECCKQNGQSNIYSKKIAELIANAPETERQRDELLKLLKKAQLSVEILINHIPTGRMRNILTEENIEILSLIEKTENQ